MASSISTTSAFELDNRSALSGRDMAISRIRALLKDPKAGAFCKADITFDDVRLFCNICAVLFLSIEHAFENVEYETICNRVTLLAINYKFPLKLMKVAM